MKTHSSSHFEGKGVVEHLKEARKRGALAVAEVHGTEMPGHLSAAADAAKETCIALLLLWAICAFFLKIEHTFFLLLLFSFGFVIWKTARSSLLGWSRMERLHRLIEEERWEIEHHRSQEREELKEMYKAKGFQGKLLEEVLDVLMADDNRLLKVMLEEELGLTLEVYEHPLKQAAGALVGSLVASALFLSSFCIQPLFLPPIASALLLWGSTLLSAKLERNRPLHAVIWVLSVAILTIGSVYFLTQLLVGHRP